MPAEQPASQPIVCSLSASDLADRGAAWRRLLGSGLVERTRVPGGLRLSARPEAGAELMRLIELERECCGWIRIEVSGGTVATLTAAGEGEAVLAAMFVPS